MKLRDCLDIGIECGMSTVGMCVANVQIHCMCMFVYERIPEELAELNAELHDLMQSKKFALSDSSTEILNFLEETSTT